MYLVGLPRIAADLNASEAQLHIAFSVYLAGMAAAMLFAGKIADQSGRKPVAIVGALIFILLPPCVHSPRAVRRSGGPFYSGNWRRLLLCSGFCDFARYARRAPPGEGAVSVERYHLYRAGSGPGNGASDYAQIPVAEPVLHDDWYGRGSLPAIGVYPARIAPSDALKVCGC